MLLLLLFCAAALVLVACGALLSFNVLQTRFRRQLESAEAAWHLRHQQDSPGTVIESVSVGWLNLLLQSLWTPVLEKHASGLTTELLSKVFAEVLEKHSQKSPWKYLESISIEGLSFGTVPPAFQVMSAKFDPTASMLTFSTDVRFTTNSAQAVLLVCSKTVGPIAPVTVPLEVTHVKLCGRLRLGVLLGQEAPGIQGVYYSFTSPPHLDVAVRPLGLPLPSVIPGVDTALRGVLTKLVGRRMVEPQRRYLDVHRIYLNRHIARVGGPGGLLRVIVVNASSLCPPGQQQQRQQTLPAAAVGSSPDARRAGKKGSSKSATASTSGDAAKLSAYCEVRFGPAVLRTPIAHLAGAAVADWSFQFSLALPFELDAWPAAQAAGASGGSSSRGVAAGGAAGRGSAGSQRASAAGSDAADPNLYLSVFDAQTVGQPVLLGKAKVTLCPLQLQPNGPARTLVLPLHKASNSRAAVQLHVQWLKSTKRPPAQDAAGAPRRMQQGQRVVGAPSSLTQPPPQAPQAQASSPQLVPRSVSASAVSGKAVSWQDKTSLRVKSATAAAKKSAKEFVTRSGSSHSGSGKLQHAADAVAAERGDAAASAAAGDTPAAGPGQQAQHDGAGPWSADRRSLSPTGSGEQGAAAAGAGDASPVTAAARGQQGAAAAPYLDVQQAGMPAAAGASGSGFLSGWLGSWIWAEASAQEPASASASPTPQASTRHVSGSSPWATGSGEDVDEDEDGWDSRQESVGVLSSSSSPLALLSHVVLLQKELEQQRAALSAMQQQLDHTSNSYQRLKQVCRQRGRAALLQGAGFVLHKADGSTQHVLLYLTHAGSSRGVQPSRLGRQPQQPQQPEQGLLLAIAALPETRSEARAAFKRLAAGAGEGPAVGDDSNHSAQARASSAGGSPPNPQGSRLSAFGSVGAGLRLRLLQRGTILQSGYDSGKLPRSALQLLKAVPARQLVGVVRGNRHFSVPASGGGGSSSAGGQGPAGAECFTVMVQEDGGGQVTAINLQLPLVGNGRDLNEWILAVRDVAAAGHQPGAAAAAVGDQPAAQGQPSGAVQEAVGTSTAGGGLGQGAAADAAAGEASSSAGQSGPGVAERPAAAVARDPPLSYKVAVEPAAADWVLPAAASATPRPWAGGAAAASDVGGASSGTDDDDNADTDDTD